FQGRAERDVSFEAVAARGGAAGRVVAVAVRRFSTAACGEEKRQSEEQENGPGTSESGFVTRHGRYGGMGGRVAAPPAPQAAGAGCCRTVSGWLERLEDQRISVRLRDARICARITRL